MRNHLSKSTCRCPQTDVRYKNEASAVWPPTERLTSSIFINLNSKRHLQAISIYTFIFQLVNWLNGSEGDPGPSHNSCCSIWRSWLVRRISCNQRQFLQDARHTAGGACVHLNSYTFKLEIILPAVPQFCAPLFQMPMRLPHCLLMALFCSSICQIQH